MKLPLWQFKLQLSIATGTVWMGTWWADRIMAYSMYKAGGVRLLPMLKGFIGLSAYFPSPGDRTPIFRLVQYSAPLAADDKSRMLPRAATTEIGNYLPQWHTHLHYSAARGRWVLDLRLAENTDVLDVQFFTFSPPAMERMNTVLQCTTRGAVSPPINNVCFLSLTQRVGTQAGYTHGYGNTTYIVPSRDSRF